MIQRIQSVWLALAAICMAMCFMFPVAEYHLSKPQTQQEVNARLDLVAKNNPEMWNQIQNMEPVINYDQKTSGFRSWMLVALVILTEAIAIGAIFLYSNRVRQMRVVAVAFLFNVVYVFLVFFWAVDSYGKTVQRVMEATDSQVIWQVGAYAPIVSLIFFVLAHRAIKRDEAKVRAADRLR